MSLHDPDCECAPGDENYSYGCELRRKGVQVSPAATPNRQHHVHRPIVKPSWEAGTVGETRPGGTRMPFLDEKLVPIGVKKFGQHRHEYLDKLRALRNSTPAP